MFNESRLQMAAIAGQSDEVRRLLEEGADVNARDMAMSTALHDAVFCCNDECVRILLRYGADARARGQWSRTPADVADEQGRTEVANMLRRVAQDYKHVVPIPKEAENYPMQAITSFREGIQGRDENI